MEILCPWYKRNVVLSTLLNAITCISYDPGLRKQEILTTVQTPIRGRAPTMVTLGLSGETIQRFKQRKLKLQFFSISLSPSSLPLNISTNVSLRYHKIMELPTTTISWEKTPAHDLVTSLNCLSCTLFKTPSTSLNCLLKENIICQLLCRLY